MYYYTCSKPHKYVLNQMQHCTHVIFFKKLIKRRGSCFPCKTCKRNSCHTVFFLIANEIAIHDIVLEQYCMYSILKTSFKYKNIALLGMFWSSTEKIFAYKWEFDFIRTSNSTHFFLYKIKALAIIHCTVCLWYLWIFN